MKIDVKNVAKLANLSLSDSEEEKYSGQLSKILDYIDQLDKVKTESEPIFNVSQNRSVMREDVVGDSLTQEEALSNASQGKGGFFVTKGVFKDE
jgi:aspartyl-tRNA(Asn)/glutamyl-tRNA(Gln) amidotransferase subunit C